MLHELTINRFTMSKTVANLHGLGFKLIFHLPYSPDIAQQDFSAPRSEENDQGKEIAETAVYIKITSFAYYENFIEIGYVVMLPVPNFLPI